MAELHQDLVLVGLIQKPYGLLGEVKIKPESFDIERHAKLKKVFCLRRSDNDLVEIKVRGSRADSQFWYLKFENCLTPESVAHLSGRLLMVDSKDRLELPKGMVYFSDLPGLAVVDVKGEPLGSVVEVMETGVEEYIVVRGPRGDASIPWNDHFVKKIDLKAKRMEVDISTLRGILF